jgi:hypothetical protein
MSLYEQIKQDCSASAADEQSRQRLQKRIQKHHRAALTSFAKQSLLQDHNRVLLSVNKQSQIVRARKSVYLKKGERQPLPAQTKHSVYLRPGPYGICQ